MRIMHPGMENLYDRDTAAALARGAAAAYGDVRQMRAWAAAQGCDGCQEFRDAATDTAGFVAWAKEQAFVVFRGTRDLRNWMTDLDARRVRWNGGHGAYGAHGKNGTNAKNGTHGPDAVEVHRGFAQALESVKDALDEALAQGAPGRKNIFFAGHSLGGALAMLACARCSGSAVLSTAAFGVPPKDSAGVPGGTPGTATGTVALPKTWLYTFGQPRVGNGAWARWYDGLLRSRSFRVVHAEDIVPRVPWLLNFYRHAGTEVFYDARGAEHAGWPWWRKGLSDAAGSWRQWRHGTVALLADHHVSRYVQLLEAQRATQEPQQRYIRGGPGRRPMEHGI
jgi:triacylglycerol lipase